MLWNRWAKSPALLGLAAAFVLAGCGVPDSMLIDTGNDPQNINKDVRFRTTYYFRVFNFCRDEDLEEAGLSPSFDVDSLYRFRMTGKANALGNKVRFEAGTLRAEQIDPFGAQVTFNADANAFVVRSPSEIQEEVTRGRQLDALRELIDERDRLEKEANSAAITKLNDKIGAQIDSLAVVSAPATSSLASSVSGAAAGAKRALDAASASHKTVLDTTKAELEAAAQQFLADLPTVQTNQAAQDARGRMAAAARNIVRPEIDFDTKQEELPIISDTADVFRNAITGDDQNVAAIAALDNALTALSDAATSAATGRQATRNSLTASLRALAGNEIPNCSDVRRGFQILGPEGWRPFDQEERLLMAMSSQATPLISTLQELSGRILNAQPNEALTLAPILANDRIVARAEPILADETLKESTRVQQVVAVLGGTDEDTETGDDQ